MKMDGFQNFHSSKTTLQQVLAEKTNINVWYCYNIVVPLLNEAKTDILICNKF